MVERFSVKGWNDDHIQYADPEGKWVHYDDYAALAAELETVKKLAAERYRVACEFRSERDEALDRAVAAESQLDKREAGEAEITRIGFAVLDWLHDKHLIKDDCEYTVQGTIAALSALTHPVPTHEDGSGEVVAWQRRLLPGPRVTNTDWHTVTKEQVDYAIEHGHPYGIPSVKCEVRPLYTRPDHTSGEVTEAMVQRALIAIHDNPDPWPDLMRAALEAALRGDAS